MILSTDFLLSILRAVGRRAQVVIQEHKTLVPWGERQLQSSGYRFPELLKYPLAVLIGLGASLIGVELELLNLAVHVLLFFIDKSLVPLVAAAKILFRAWGCVVKSSHQARWMAVGFLMDVSSVEAVTKCGVCANSMETPWVLACGHVFCRNCLVSWFDTILGHFLETCQDELADDDTPEPPYTCPYCRFSVHSPPAPCFALKAIMDDVGKLKGSCGGQAVDRDWSKFWPEEAELLRATVEDNEVVVAVDTEIQAGAGPQETLEGLQQWEEA
ncbi:E3 ubiquitin ligase [Marasmius tenuissimus]|uniref:E3 ubiquitin ligase n=1 Tax=Marasmius tenuissimus TaxID=585030 RepID=A0ABR2ZIX4_9AGAR